MKPFFAAHLYEIPITLPAGSHRKNMPSSARIARPARANGDFAATDARGNAVSDDDRPSGLPPQGASHAGPRHAGHRARLLRIVDRLHDRLRSALRRTAMIFDYSLAGLVTVGLMIYLTYALLKPERL
jgi:K+-transporting ATPase KdpF subunit